jgi:4-amino-4-deoxy-L-arabinose transferase-like glycosyltransferase
LALFYKFFGSTQGVAHVANALVGALLAVVTWLLGREALSPTRARVAGALVALHPGLILYGALVMTEPLSALLVLLAFWITLRVARTKRAGALAGIAAGALCLGFAVLVRPQALLCAPFLALAAWRIGKGARLVTALLVACVVTIVPVLPWTARNCRVMDGCALVSTNAGWNLAIGAFPRATGRFETLRSEDGCREVTGQVQQDRCWLEYGLASIRSAPRHWLMLIPAKLSFTFDHESFAVEYLHEARPAAWPEERRVRWRGVLTAIHRGLVALALFAFVAWPRPGAHGFVAQTALAVTITTAICVAFAASNPTFWPLVLAGCVVPWLPFPGRPAPQPALLMAISLIATTVLAHAVFFGEDRYHVVATPVLCLLAASVLRRGSPKVSCRKAAPSTTDNGTSLA